jgi:hypothetical protein
VNSPPATSLVIGTRRYYKFDTFRRFVTPGNRIHAIVNQTGAATGRLSGVNPNMQARFLRAARLLGRRDAVSIGILDQRMPDDPCAAVLLHCGKCGAWLHPRAGPGSDGTARRGLLHSTHQPLLRRPRVSRGRGRRGWFVDLGFN